MTLHFVAVLAHERCRRVHLVRLLNAHALRPAVGQRRGCTARRRANVERFVDIASDASECGVGVRRAAVPQLLRQRFLRRAA
eukprot:209640-Prymnesium_polylepis.1